MTAAADAATETIDSPDERPGPARPFHVLGWAAYLGISWTWCIGMFLPVLLVRDYGLWGWIVFATPNVIGAAAMGWVMTRVRDPEAFDRKHSLAITSFSVVTAAFHLFFMNWMIARLIPAGGAVAMLAIIPLFIAGLMGARRRGGAALGVGDVPAAVAVFAVSLIAWVAYLRYGYGPPLAGEPTRRLAELWWLAPICVFGFALNPYLDRTFHYAYRATGRRGGPGAFAIGFGAVFLLMILFTLTYARALAPVVEERAFVLPGVALWAIGIHMAFQGAFTTAIHLRATGRVATSLLAAALLAAVIYGLGHAVAGRIHLSPGESAYRLFMAFYGLVFPAYAWLCMWPDGGRRTVPARAWLALAIAVGVAAPMFWLGFMHQRTAWLLPGLAVVLLARLSLPRSRGAGNGA